MHTNELATLLKDEDLQEQHAISTFPLPLRDTRFVDAVVVWEDGDSYDMLERVYLLAPTWFAEEDQILTDENGVVVSDPSAVIMTICFDYGIASWVDIRWLSIRHARKRQIPDWMAYECALMLQQLTLNEDAP